MYNVAVVGASGLVGKMMLKVLAEYNFPIKNLKVFASNKSVGKEIIYNNQKFYLEELCEDSFKDIDIALFSAGGETSLKWAPVAEASGAIVIDNSSAWRMNDECGLIVPEINIDSYRGKRKIIANPNCSTIQSVIPLFALLKEYHLERINFSSYQAVSGSGYKGLNDYHNTLAGKEASFYPYNISKTCIPQIDSFLDNGYTKEEMKMVNETKKILNLPELKITATCIRVPVEFGHGVSMHIECKEDIDLTRVTALLKAQEGIVVLDELPTSIHALENDYVYVGRIRKDLNNPKGLLLYCVANNIRKGAASNAVQIALKLIKEGYLC